MIARDSLREEIYMQQKQLLIIGLVFGAIGLMGPMAMVLGIFPAYAATADKQVAFARYVSEFNPAVFCVLALIAVPFVRALVIASVRVVRYRTASHSGQRAHRQNELISVLAVSNHAS